jgi:3-methyladenine DNA glycosylase/8-oxoguanine DNA glycosylase
MDLTIKTPRGFSFRRTVRSHGWYALPPFELDKANWLLWRVLDRGQTAPVTIKISSANSGIKISSASRFGKKALKEIECDVRHMLRLDDDLQAFYRITSANPEFAWVADQGAGRLLRSPTVFEDLVKMICTTNCSWALTEKMVGGLVDNLGRAAPDGRKSFPGAAAMANESERFFRDRIRAGYRAPYLKELAQRVASGSLDVESWFNSELPLDELMKEMKSVKGVGNYAAENLLKLIGRYDGLALDSWTRAQFARLRNNGRVASDKKISRFYHSFNSWRGLVLWCDMTRDWLDAEKTGT